MWYNWGWPCPAGRDLALYVGRSCGIRATGVLIRTASKGVTVDAIVEQDGIHSVQITAAKFRVPFGTGRVLSVAVTLDHGNELGLTVIDSGDETEAEAVESGNGGGH